MNMLTSWHQFLSKVVNEESSSREDSLSFWLYNIYCPSAEVLFLIKSLGESIKNEGIGECYLTNDFLSETSLKDVNYSDIEGEKLNFSITKTPLPSECFFFTIEGFKTALRERKHINSVEKVYFLSDFSCFASFSTWYLPWKQEPPHKIGNWNGLIDPRKLSRDLTNRTLIPNDIRPWLLFYSDESSTSEEFDAWKLESIKNISYSLCSELDKNDSQILFCAKCEKTRNILFHDELFEQDQHNFSIFQDVAKWIFSSKEDAEAKHTFLNYHIAIECSDSTSWPDPILLKRSFDDAKQAYKLHLHKSSKDFLKSLNDLRKSLYDDVSRISTNTSNLISSLWRDFSIAGIVIVLNIAQKSTSLKPEHIKIITYLTLSYLFVSFLVTITSNHKFNMLAKKNRDNWHSKIYSFLNQEDYTQLIEDPIGKGYKIYKKTACFIGFAYLLCILILLGTAHQFPSPLNFLNLLN